MLLQDFVARPYGESAKPEKNPLRGFGGFGFSTQTHAAGVSPYPATSAEDLHNVYNDMPEGKYPFDERKDGLKETMHTWKKWDWKKAPSAAIDEVNVWGNTGLAGTTTSDDSGADTSWNLGDKMSFAWQHWKQKGHEQVCVRACICTCLCVCVTFEYLAVRLLCGCGCGCGFCSCSSGGVCVFAR